MGKRNSNLNERANTLALWKNKISRCEMYVTLHILILSGIIKWIFAHGLKHIRMFRLLKARISLSNDRLSLLVLAKPFSLKTADFLTVTLCFNRSKCLETETAGLKGA